MSKMRGSKNVESRLRQQVLSGWSDYGKPEGYLPDNENVGKQKQTPQGFWEQKSYIAFIPVIIEPTSTDSNGNEYSIQIAADIDIPLHTFSKRSKIVSKQVFSVPGKKGKASYKIPVVYGIQPDGDDSLSHPAGYTTVQAVANTYSAFLGKVATALKCLLLNSKGEEASTVDKGKRNEGTQSPKDLGESKKSRRSGEVRSEVRNKAIPKVPANLDEVNGKILGNRQGDGTDRLQQVGDDSYRGTGLENFSVDF